MPMKTCPYCAEEIQQEAVRCRYCRSRLTRLDSASWHRDHPEAKIAGVCAALARAFAVPIAAVRLAFIAFTLIFHFAPFAYIALWLAIPATPGRASHLEQCLRALLDLVGTGSPHHEDGPWNRHGDARSDR